MSNENNISEKETTETENGLADRSGASVGFTLEPRNLKEALKICEYLASSSLVPKQYQGKPADILVCINWGMEVGLKPLQALSNIAVINGTPSMWGSAPLALVRNSPEFEFILEDNEAFAYARDKINGWSHLQDVNPNDTSICVVKRKDEPPLVREFSKEDVKMAGLGNVHKNYPKDMRKYRARSRALEASFGDVLKGLRQAELEKENHQMIEEGHWEDVTIADKDPVQPTAGRKSIDIQKDEGVPGEAKDSIDRDGIMKVITDRAKEHYKDEWYKGIKTHLVAVNPDAQSMLDLSDEDLEKLQVRMANLSENA